MTTQKTKKHPMQPIVKDKHKVPRFKENPIVNWMLEMGNEGKRFDLNTIACVSPRLGWKKEDHMQIAQLIGYSVSGYGDLSYASKASVEEADKMVEKLYAEA